MTARASDSMFLFIDFVRVTNCFYDYDFYDYDDDNDVMLMQSLQSSSREVIISGMLTGSLSRCSSTPETRCRLSTELEVVTKNVQLVMSRCIIIHLRSC